MVHLRSEKLQGYGVRVTPTPYDENEPSPHVNELNMSLTPSALKVEKFYRPAEKDLTLMNANIE